MKTVAYLRVSTRSQDLANQKLAILEFSQKRRFPIDQFIESRISSRHSPLERRIDEMLATLEPGDRLLVSELSRLGRSLCTRSAPMGLCSAAMATTRTCRPLMQGSGRSCRSLGFHDRHPGREGWRFFSRCWRSGSLAAQTHSPIRWIIVL